MSEMLSAYSDVETSRTDPQIKWDSENIFSQERNEPLYEDLSCLVIAKQGQLVKVKYWGTPS